MVADDKDLEGFSRGKVISQLQVAPEGETRMEEAQDQRTDFLPQFDPPHNHTRGFTPTVEREQAVPETSCQLSRRIPAFGGKLSERLCEGPFLSRALGSN